LTESESKPKFRLNHEVVNSQVLLYICVTLMKPVQYLHFTDLTFKQNS